MLIIFTASHGAAQELADSLTMFKNLSVSEVTKRLSRIATNKATPTEELWYSHVKVLVATLSQLKKTAELKTSETPGFFTTLVNGLLGQKDAQNRLTAQSLNKVLDLYLSNQVDEWQAEINTSGKPRYTPQQIEKLKNSSILSSAKRIISGQATRVERILLWIAVKVDAVIGKIRSWSGGENLGKETEIATITKAAKDIISNVSTALKAKVQKTLKELSDKKIKDKTHTNKPPSTEDLGNPKEQAEKGTQKETKKEDSEDNELEEEN